MRNPMLTTLENEIATLLARPLELGCCATNLPGKSHNLISSFFSKLLSIV